MYSVENLDQQFGVNDAVKQKEYKTPAVEIQGNWNKSKC